MGLIGNAHRMWAHVQYVMIPRYNVNVAQDNRDLRIKFILGDVTEDEFKKKIQQREKARQRKTDIRQVLEMFNAVIIDLFQTFMQDQQLTPLLDSLWALRPHVNTTFDTVSKRYSRCAVPHVTEYYDVV
jgi:16S rRNA C1402 N4-methylase RsmH